MCDTSAKDPEKLSHHAVFNAKIRVFRVFFKYNEYSIYIIGVSEKKKAMWLKDRSRIAFAFFMEIRGYA
jgi:hypothetical protein